MGIAGCLEQTKRGHGFGGSLFHLRLTRFDSHCVALKIHHLEIEIAWNALVAPPVEQNDETVAVFRRLPVSAPADRDAEPALPHLRDEYVLHVGLITGDFLHKKTPGPRCPPRGTHPVKLVKRRLEDSSGACTPRLCRSPKATGTATAPPSAQPAAPRTTARAESRRGAKGPNQTKSPSPTRGSCAKAS